MSEAETTAATAVTIAPASAPAAPQPIPTPVPETNEHAAAILAQLPSEKEIREARVTSPTVTYPVACPTCQTRLRAMTGVVYRRKPNTKSSWYWQLGFATNRCAVCNVTHFGVIG